MEIIQVIRELLPSAFVICISMPDFHFYNMLFSKIVYDKIHAFTVPGLCLDITVSGSVDDRA